MEKVVPASVKPDDVFKGNISAMPGELTSRLGDWEGKSEMDNSLLNSSCLTDTLENSVPKFDNDKFYHKDTAQFGINNANSPKNH